MPTTYSPNLRISIIETGSQAGVWGDTTNTNLGTLLEQSISGYQEVSITLASQALTAVNGATDQARMAMIRLTTTTGAAFGVFVPPLSKQYIFKNASGQTATIYCATALNGVVASGGTTIVVPNGATIAVWSDGTNISLQNQNSVTPTAGTNDTQVATTAFVRTALQILYPIGTIYTSTVSANPAATFGFGVWSAYGGGKVLVGFLASDPLFGTGGQLQGFPDTPIVSHTHTITLASTTHTHSGTTAAAGAASGTITAQIPSDFGAFQTGSATGAFAVGGTSFGNRMQGASGTGSRSTVTMTIADHQHTITTGNNSATPTASSLAPAGAIAGTDRNYQPSITVYMWKRDS